MIENPSLPLGIRSDGSVVLVVTVAFSRKFERSPASSVLVESVSGSA